MLQMINPQNKLIAVNIQAHVMLSNSLRYDFIHCAIHSLIARNTPNLLCGPGLKTGASRRKETLANSQEILQRGFKLNTTRKKTIGLTISASKLLCHWRSVFNGTLLMEEDKMPKMIYNTLHYQSVISCLRGLHELRRTHLIRIKFRQVRSMTST